MKKTLSIILLGLFLFNCFGYRLLMNYIESRADQDMEEHIDNNNYDESRLISVKFPISYLPYYNNSAAFERINGQIEIHGTPYKYVKRRIYNDSLELLCIPNTTVMQLRSTTNEIFKFVNDLQAGKKSESHPRSFKVSSVNDYISNDPFQYGKLFYTASLKSAYHAVHFPVGYVHREERPPQNA